MLSCFITEVKKVDGTDFPCKTLYNIVICIHFHLETLGFGWKIIKKEAFKDIKFTLDSIMKIHTRQGLGHSVYQATVLNATNEEYLWSLGYFGTYNPQVLLNTLVLMIGKGFALCAGKENYKLRVPPFNSQLQFVHDQNGIFIRNTKDRS